MRNQASIEQKLQSALAPVRKMLVARHRMVNEILAEDLQRIHALALHTYTPEEWAERGQAPQSPPCQGGGKQQ